MTPSVIPVQTTQKSQMVDITRLILEQIPNSFDGLCHLFCMHTTAGLTVNENADPDVVHDMLLELDRIAPWGNPAFRHLEGNSAAHVKSSLVGCDLTLAVQRGKLLLGTWQGVYFCEFDGPRQRRVAVSCIQGI